MVNINVKFCQLMLRAVIADIAPHTTAAERKAAYVMHVMGDWEFHGPDRFYWYGSADNAYDARAKGWQAWMRSKGLEA